MAGPDEIQSTGVKIALPHAVKNSLRDYRVAIWENDEQAPVTEEIRQRVVGVGQAIIDAGGEADFTARPNFQISRANDVYQTLLQGSLGTRIPEDEYKKIQQEAATLNSSDHSLRAQTLRRQVASHRDIAFANEARTHLRWAWHEFFKDYDALIAPIMAVPAVDHDHGPLGERTVMVDNVERPYFEQVFWAGLAICSYLPATVIPTGPNAEGLPIGVQIIGPEYGDLKTIALARHLEEVGFAFTPPPGY